MTKNEFTSFFNDKIEEKVSILLEPETFKRKMREYSGGSDTISNDEMVAFALGESINFCKDLVYSTLLEVLQFDD